MHGCELRFHNKRFFLCYLPNNSKPACTERNSLILQSPAGFEQWGGYLLTVCGSIVEGKAENVEAVT
jgi:hypothetical protein